MVLSTDFSNIYSLGSLLIHSAFFWHRTELFFNPLKHWSVQWGFFTFFVVVFLQFDYDLPPAKF